MQELVPKDFYFLFFYFFLDCTIAVFWALSNCFCNHSDKEFGKSSGYRVHFQKIELMPVGTSNDEMDLNSLPFKISPPKFKYPGLWITNKHKDLYTANCQHLVASLNQDIKQWNPLLSL